MNIASYSDPFDDTLGCSTEYIKLTVTEDPTSHRVRKVLYAIQYKVEETLNKMESDGIIFKVKTSSCAAPIVYQFRRNLVTFVYVETLELHTINALLLQSIQSPE